MSQPGKDRDAKVQPAAGWRSIHESPDHSKNIRSENISYLKNAERHDLKFIFITGGVISSLGKGVAGASLGALLKGMGYAVSMQKLDPYLNTDAGTMNPLQHGEVYVTDDGAETDMDLGHYERLLDTHLPVNSCFTSGFIYSRVIETERQGSAGEYRGKTIQIVPHVTDMIKHVILRQTISGAKVIMVEIGGTVGDIEGLPFCEAVHELRNELPPRNTLSIHLTYLPYLRISGETKTKPTQHSVKELRAVGLRPDIIICRSDEDVTEDTRYKIAKTCGVAFDSIFVSKNLDYVYMLPEHFKEQRLVEKVCELLSLEAKPFDIGPMIRFTSNLAALKKEVRIAVVGKYVDQESPKDRQEGVKKKPITYYESYKSVIEALSHAGVRHGRRVDICPLEADDFKFLDIAEELSSCDGILVPGGFGDRGYEQMLAVIRYAREGGKPFFGICFGLQLAIVEYARNVLGLPHASSEEFRNPLSDPPGEDFIYFMSSWYNYRTGTIDYRKRDSSIGGTMRLGLQPCFLNPGTRAYSAYRGAYDEGLRRGAENRSYVYDEVPLTESINVYRTAFSQDIDPKTLADLERDAREKGLLTVYERHRHRYEINPAFHAVLTLGPGGADRFVISGEAPKFTVKGQNTPPHIVEVMELEKHPWFLGCQFHPEFLSRPLRPHPLFLDFVKAASDFKDRRKSKGQHGS
jgi:CTP synthase